MAHRGRVRDDEDPAAATGAQGNLGDDRFLAGEIVEQTGLTQSGAIGDLPCRGSRIAPFSEQVSCCCKNLLLRACRRHMAFGPGAPDRTLGWLLGVVWWNRIILESWIRTDSLSPAA